jgi:hypothetical protein
MNNKYKELTKWKYTIGKMESEWTITAIDNSIWLEQVGDPHRTRVDYGIKEFDKLVKEGKFEEIPTKPKSNNMKRSHLLNFMNSMYTLGQMDWGKTGGPVTRTPEEIETLFNEFVKENG